MTTRYLHSKHFASISQLPQRAFLSSQIRLKNASSHLPCEMDVINPSFTAANTHRKGGWLTLTLGHHSASGRAGNSPLVQIIT